MVTLPYTSCLGLSDEDEDEWLEKSAVLVERTDDKKRQNNMGAARPRKMKSVKAKKVTTKGLRTTSKTGSSIFILKTAQPPPHPFLRVGKSSVLDGFIIKVLRQLEVVFSSS